MGSQLGNQHVALIGASAFLRCCKEASSDPVVLHFVTNEVTGKSSTIDPTIPSELHEFADVFDEGLSDKLAPHHLYDLKIEIEEGASQPISRIYPLSDLELSALQKFVEDHLRMGFIRPSSSPFAAPVLFVKKKNGDLRLCVDFRALNRITKKDRYLLTLISELLDTSRRAKIYTKLDL